MEEREGERKKRFVHTPTIFWGGWRGGMREEGLDESVSLNQSSLGGGSGGCVKVAQQNGHHSERDGGKKES